jgi:hypothetical protein
MATLGQLKYQIASDLRRSDLTTEIAAAITDAIRNHSTERFWFNQTATYALSTVNGTDEYTLAESAPILEFIEIDRVKAQVGSTWYTLMRLGWDEMDELFATATSGQPSDWAFTGSNEFRLYPTPNAVYPIEINGHYRLSLLTEDSQFNAWTTEGKDLIRYTALKRLFAFPIRNMEQLQSADAAGMRELEYLRRETEKRTRFGYMRPYYG